MTDHDRSIPLSDAELARLDELLASEGLDHGVSPERIVARPDATEAPQSFAQELLWMLQEAHPALSSYNIGISRRIAGPLDVPVLERSLRFLAERHTLLRTTFHPGSPDPVQRLTPAAGFRLGVIDLRQLAPAERRAAGQERLEEELRRPFDLGQEPPLRVRLVRIGDGEWFFGLVSHHIVLDGWSIGILLSELSNAYSAFLAGKQPTLPALPISYGDYAGWERRTVAGERLESTMAYWRRQLEGAQFAIALPSDRSADSPTAQAGEVVRRVLPPQLLEDLKRLGNSRNSTLYMTLVAGFQALLSRISGQDDIVIGSAIGGRPRPETHGLVGYFSGALPIRSRFDGNPSFNALLTSVREAVLGALEHGEVPVERLSLELAREQAMAGRGLFQVVLTMAGQSSTTLALGDCVVEPMPVSLGATKFDLTLFPVETPQGLALTLSYRTSLFSEAAASSLLGQLETLLSTAVRSPETPVGALPLLTAAEQAQVAKWQGPVRPFPGIPLADRLKARAAAPPTAVAVQCGATALTYGALQTRATAIGQALGAAGVQPGDRVGLFLERSADLFVGVQGIWLAGAAYVPLLPELPAARIATLIQESGIRAVVTSAALAPTLPADVTTLRLADVAAPTAAALPGARPDGLAYVLFTSGSTGVPKGVAVTHANLAHYVEAISDQLGLALDGSTPWHSASVSTLAADLGHTAVFPFLAAGGTLHLLPTAVAMEPAHWAQYAAQHRLDLLKIAPSHLKALVGDATGPDLAALLPHRWLVLGGEAAPLPFIAALRAAGGPRVLNHYGPTETTVGACTYLVDAEPVPAETLGSLPIGRPLPNLRAEVRSPHGQLQPVGVPGELWLGGPQIAQGYLGRPDLTAERFRTDAQGVRWYRSGDRVRWLSTGAIEFLGRLDAQVKVRGHRVELEEVERVLAAVPGVTQAAVRLHEDALAAYLVADVAVTDAQLQAAAQAALPDYMVPTHWTRLPRLPLNPNGKLDRAQLPAPVAATAAGAADEAPRGPVETQLAQLWGEVLKRDGIGREANFFTLGGHSLLAIRLLGKISKTFGVRLALRQLFDAPTIAQLAAVVAPAHPLEAPLATLWAEILKQDRVGRDDNFFTLGGHSLLAIRLLGRISKQFGVRLALRDLFEAPTIALLGPRLEREPASGSATEVATAASARPSSGIARRTRQTYAPPSGDGHE